MRTEPAYRGSIIGDRAVAGGGLTAGGARLQDARCRGGTHMPAVFHIPRRPPLTLLRKVKGRRGGYATERRPRGADATWASLFVALILSLGLASAAAAQSPDTPRTGVIDQAHVIDAATAQKINAVLLELEQKGLAMFKVLVVNSTNGADPHDYAIKTARKWQLGTRGKNNGFLLLVAVKDRKWRFETGEGLEGAVPDLFTDGVARQDMVPSFKQGDFAQGIYLGVMAVARKIAADQGVQLSSLASMPAEQAERRRPSGHQPVVAQPGGAAGAGVCCTCLFPFLILLIIASLISRRRTGYYRTWGGGGFWQGMLLASLLSGSSRRGGWSGGSWGGGGFGGGGGGGFGGGFGGSFGGGGSGGSW